MENNQNEIDHSDGVRLTLEDVQELERAGRERIAELEMRVRELEEEKLTLEEEVYGLRDHIHSDGVTVDEMLTREQAIIQGKGLTRRVRT